MTKNYDVYDTDSEEDAWLFQHSSYADFQGSNKPDYC